MCKESRLCGRYNVGYRHWIEGCLRYGAKLYIGVLNEEALTLISEVDGMFLIINPFDNWLSAP